MSITRLNHFKSYLGKADALRDILTAAVPTIRSSPGCQSCELLQSRADATRFVVVEVWDRIESHQAAVKAIPAEAFAGVMELLDGRPHGEYFENCESS